MHSDSAKDIAKPAASASSTPPTSTSTLAAADADAAAAPGVLPASTESPPFLTAVNHPPTAPSPLSNPISSSASSASTSHKRGREPSAMTDPSEAARYTPPREMFRQPNTFDTDDLVSLPSEDGLPEADTDTPNPSQPSGAHIASDPFHGDHELDSLGQQLSIHSPEKTNIGSADNDNDQAKDTSKSDSSDPPGHTLTNMQVQLHLEHELEQEYGPHPEPRTIPPFDEQLAKINDLSRRSLEVGDEWYLINQKWFVDFKRYCTRMARGDPAAQHPGEIDNSVLLIGNTLRQDVQHTVQTVPQEGWDLLVYWYGTTTEPIMRRVVNTGSAISPNLLIDYYPPIFTLYKVVEASRAEDLIYLMNTPETLAESRSTKFVDLMASLRLQMAASPREPARLWVIPPGAAETNALGNVISADEVIRMGCKCLDNVDEDATLAELSDLVKGGDIALEVSIDGKFIVPYSPTRAMDAIVPSSFNRGLQINRSSPFTIQAPSVNGICGLSNLGNTCFMNSALQCLSNTPDLTRYILAGAWRDELNVDNPLGMGGEVARAYANVIDKLWNGSNKVFSPREFKMTIGRFAPSFTGYHQHDSQELLAFLLDGLHEDLNRIIKKPYTETPDSNGRPDEEVANDCWKLHKARNDSVIVDLFQGQYKSTLVCPECQKISVTFDPFMYLSLPLPIVKKWIGTITYVPYDPSKPLVDIRLQLPKGSSQKQLKEKIAEMMGTQGSHLYAAEIFSNRIYKTHDNSDAVDELSETDKNFVYELPVPDFTTAPDHITFPVHNILDTMNQYGRLGSAHPMMVTVSKEEAVDPDAVYRAIIEQASRYTTMDLYEDDSEAAMEDDRSDDDSTDVDMSPHENNAGERRPRKGLFRMMAFMPPPPRHHYRSYSKPSLYATNTATPSANEMEDMYERAARQDTEESEKSSDDDDDDDDDDYEPNKKGSMFRKPSSPSSRSGSSRSSSRPRVPEPEMDELSEDDDPATLGSNHHKNGGMRNRKVEKPSRPVRVAEPVVRQGEMVYCIWSRAMESSIFAPEKKFRSSYRYMDEEEDQNNSSAKILWDSRAPLIIDPELQAELLSKKKGGKEITLEDCLAEYTREEQLGEDDLWYCPNCKKHIQATKKLDIWRFPDILVVHLKRFSHTRAWRDKLDVMVDFPINDLDLSDKALHVDGQENIYDLFGVSNHMGGLGGGHYTAYAKNERLNEWYNFDDSHVSKVYNEDMIKSSSAYLLFYRRRSAAVREYEQRPREEEPIATIDSTRRGFMEPSSSRAVMLADKDDDDDPYMWDKPGPRPNSLMLHAKDTDNFDSWSKRDDSPYDEWGKPGPDGDGMMMLDAGVDDDGYGWPKPMIGPQMDSDPDLPPYSASGRTSPSSFMSDKRRGSDAEDDGLPSASGVSEFFKSRNDGRPHSPDLSTCASDGSNPGTANASRGPTPEPFLSEISREGGRIDDSDTERAAKAATAAESGTRSLTSNGPIGALGAGIPTPNSAASGSGTVEDDAEDDGQNEVHMVGWNEKRPNGQ